MGCMVRGSYRVLSRSILVNLLFLMLCSTCPAVTISGTVRNPMGSALGGDNTVRASGGAATNAPVGTYTLTVNSGWSGVLVVERANEGGIGNYAAFNPQLRAYTNVTSDLSGQDFTILGIVPPPPAGNNFRTISGKVTNSAGEGVFDVLLTASTNGGAALTYSNGTYNLGYFFTSDPWSGTVTPSRTDTTFDPESRSYAGINTTQGEQNYLASGGGGSLLSIVKSANSSVVTAGQQVAFTLTVTNTSAETASNTVVRDTLSAWLTNDVAAGNGGTYNAGARTITWTLGHFAAGAGTALTFNAAVGSGFGPGMSITNTASVASDLSGTNVSNLIILQGAWPVSLTNKIVFCRQAGSSDWDIWLMDTDGGNQAVLLDDAYASRMPRFNPDGTKICFVRMFTGSSNDVFVMNADGSGITNLTIGSAVAGKSMSPRFSWDGTKICFDVQAQQTNHDLWVMNADGSGKTGVLTTADDDTTPAFSPDGLWLAFQRLITMDPDPLGPICKVRLSDGYVTNLTLDDDLDEMPVFSPDGTDLIYKHGADSPEIYRCPSDYDCADTNQLTNLTQTPGAADDSPAYNGDGTKIAYMSNTGVVNGMEIWIMSADGSGKQQLTSNSQNDFDPSFSPGTPPPEPLPSVATNKIVFSRHTTMTNWHLVMIEAEGGNEVALTSGAFMDGLPHFSPDGSRITFARITNRMQLAAMDVYAINADGTGLTNLTAGVNDGCNSPRFSWDGSQICFDRTATPGNGDLYRMSSDGTGIRPVLTTTNDDASPCFSPNGEWIVFQRKTAEDPNPKSIIAKVRITDSNVVALTDGSDVDETPMWSPDGQTIIFKRGYTNWDLFAMSADHDPGNNEDLVNLTQTRTRSIGAAMYSWEQTYIYLQSTTAGVDPDAAEIFRINPDGSGRTQLTSNAVADWDPTPSPVGLWLTASAGENGTINPTGPVRVLYNATTNFQIAASNWYHIASILTNRGEVADVGGPVTNFLWSNIRTGGTIHAAFAADLAALGTPHWWLALYYPDSNDWDAVELTDTDGDSPARIRTTPIPFSG